MKLDRHLLKPAVRGVLGDQTAQARSQHDVIARSEEAEHAVDRTKLTHQPAPGAAPDLGQLVSCPNSLGNATRSARERMHVGRLLPGCSYAEDARLDSNPGAIPRKNRRG